MTHEKLVAGTTSPTRYTKIIRNPGAGTKYNRTYQETEYVSRYTKTVAGGKDYVPPAPPEPEPEPMVVVPPTLSGTPQVGSTITCSEPVVTGGIAPYSFSYMWLDSETKSPSNDTVLLEFDEGNMVSCYVTVTDALGTIEHTESNKIGPIEPAPTIGIISLTVDDVPVVWGEAVHVPVNTPVHAVATISGDANPNYKWEARGDYPLMVGSQAATTTLTFPQEGGPTVTLTATDSKATDSPINYAMNFYVASQVEWDILHPTTTTN